MRTRRLHTAALSAVAVMACTVPDGAIPGTRADVPLPAHFRIESVGSIQDCRIDGQAATCIRELLPLPDNYESWSEEITGTVSGLTITGTTTSQATFRQLFDPTCRVTERRSGPITYEFSSDGTVVMSEGKMRYDTTESGSCSDSSSRQQWGGQGTGLWWPIS